MESSQIDIMATQLPSSQFLSSQLPSSQLPSSHATTSTNRTVHDYIDLIFFHWDHGKESPFQVHSKDLFSETEIRVEWIKFQMVSKARARKLKPIKYFSGKVMSLFAKIERGICPVRKTDIVKDLNFEFAHYFNELKSVKLAYMKMIERNPYRVLADNKYEWGEAPIRPKVSQAPAASCTTDVCMTIEN